MNDSSIKNGSVSDFEVLPNSDSSTSLRNTNDVNIHPVVLNTQISLTDMTLDEARHKLIEFAHENAELQRYMKDNNEMMKKQYETLAEWKTKVQQANIANKEKFEETKTLIFTLRAENKKIMILESDLQAKYKEADDLKTENELIFGQKEHLERQIVELKQTLSSVEKMKHEAEEIGQPIPDIETVLVQLSLDKEQEFEIMRLTLSRRDAELKESRNANESLLQDLTKLQKLKEQIQQDYQRLSRDNMELSQRMETGLTLNSLNSVNWLHVSKKRGSGEEAMEEGSEKEQPDSIYVKCFQTVECEAGSEKEREVLQQTAFDDLMKRQEMKKQEYEDQIAQLQKTIQKHQEKNEEMTDDVQEKNREIQDLKSRYERDLYQSSKQYEDKMAEFAKKLDKDREEQLKHQSLANENVESLKAQVIALMKEVHDLNNKIEAANNSIDRKNARLKDYEAKSSRTEQDMMQLGHDKDLVIYTLQKQYSILQANYTQEHNQHEINKNEVADVKGSFNRLIDDYKELLAVFNNYKMSQSRTVTEEVNKLKEDVNKLTCQVIVAEEALTLRDENVTQLKNEGASIKREYEDKLAVFKAQAEVFRLDFDAERLAREKQAQEKNDIMQEMSDLQIQNQQLLDEMENYSRRQLSEMQQRVANQPASYFHGTGSPRTQQGLPPHGYDYPSSFSMMSNPGNMQMPRPSEQLNQVEEFEFTCPKCTRHCPDLDTLQIHVVECMELD